MSSIDLSTRYLGFDLPHPLMPGASPLVDDLGAVCQLEDAGAAAIVMPSLFEEQLANGPTAEEPTSPWRSSGDALAQFPKSGHFAVEPDEYLEHLRLIKTRCAVPVIASLNGVTEEGWCEFAGLLEEAGADALELNVFQVPTDPTVSGADMEQKTLNMVRRVSTTVSLPVAVKLGPFYTALPHFAKQLELAGASGIVLFNRFYETDVDIKAHELERAIHYSTSAELLLRLRWLTILSGHLETANLAVTGGIHQTTDVVKALLSGARAVQVVSALFKNGTGHLRTLRYELQQWMEENYYGSIAEIRSSMHAEEGDHRDTFERASYVQVLQGWRRSH